MFCRLKFKGQGSIDREGHVQTDRESMKILAQPLMDYLTKQYVLGFAYILCILNFQPLSLSLSLSLSPSLSPPSYAHTGLERLLTPVSW